MEWQMFLFGIVIGFLAGFSIGAVLVTWLWRASARSGAPGRSHG